MIEISLGFMPVLLAIAIVSVIVAMVLVSSAAMSVMDLARIIAEAINGGDAKFVDKPESAHSGQKPKEVKPWDESREPTS